jgi:predicted glutamine amidotransferase
MCRALLYLGEPVLLDNLLYQPDSSLAKQSYMPRMLRMLNLAGFGMMAWDRSSIEPDTPYRYGSTNLPVFDRNLKSLAGKIKANCFLGHVRGVALDTAATINDQNIHPFWYPGAKLALAHNGDLHRFDEMRDDLRLHVRPEIAQHIAGSTDSEWIYAVLLSQLKDPGEYASSDEIRRAIDKTLAIIGNVRDAHGISVASSANLFICDGLKIFAVRFCFDFGRYATSDPAKVHEANSSYLSLWYTCGREYGFHDGEWQMTGGSAAADSIIVASEPLTSDITRWLEVPEYSTLHTERDDGRAVTNIHYIDI